MCWRTAQRRWRYPPGGPGLQVISTSCERPLVPIPWSGPAGKVRVGELEFLDEP